MPFCLNLIHIGTILTSVSDFKHCEMSAFVIMDCSIADMKMTNILQKEPSNIW